MVRAEMPDRERAGYQITCLTTELFRLDGGAMFGFVPKALWSRAIVDSITRLLPILQNGIRAQTAPTSLNIVMLAACRTWNQRDSLEWESREQRGAIPCDFDIFLQDSLGFCGHFHQRISLKGKDLSMRGPFSVICRVQHSFTASCSK